ncbi:MAG TPA: class I SAM-dependent methyltransferase [Gaiellaceae bacterium]|nr:class I SAM-dependent methyltransferase [Gaiellaceae bacterium]
MRIGGRIYAALYDRMLGGIEEAGLAARRGELLAAARGRVLEIGAGTGANLPHYGDGVEALTITEPDESMARRLEQRVRELDREVSVVRAPAERLPFGDASFDVVVSTLVLCTVPDQGDALAELRRVLVPGGRVLFIEHVRADELRLARWQHRLNGVNRVFGRGCNCNRATLDAIDAAGFTLGAVEHSELKKAQPLVRPLVVGSAVAPD